MLQGILIARKAKYSTLILNQLVTTTNVKSLVTIDISRRNPAKGKTAWDDQKTRKAYQKKLL